jgi:uncharacterized membrane protein YvlD (DUF360 family)
MVAALVPGFRLQNFGVAVMAAFLISLISWGINWLVSDTVS